MIKLSQAGEAKALPTLSLFLADFSYILAVWLYPKMSAPVSLWQIWAALEESLLLIITDGLPCGCSAATAGREGYGQGRKLKVKMIMQARWGRKNNNCIWSSFLNNKISWDPQKSTFMSYFTVATSTHTRTCSRALAPSPSPSPPQPSCAGCVSWGAIRLGKDTQVEIKIRFKGFFFFFKWSTLKRTLKAEVVTCNSLTIWTED